MSTLNLASRQYWQSFYQHDLQTWIFWAKTAAAALIGLWLAYRFQLDSPSTVVITVFIVMQSRNGMVLAKSFYRAIGTIAGSIVALLLVATFPDERLGFLAGLALWVGFCTAGARYFRNFQAYAFVLAGYTAALVGLPAALDPEHAFYIGVARLSDVMLGIMVASVMSAIVFPQPLEDLLQHTAQTRLQHFLRNTLRVLQGGVPRADWIALHLEAIQEILQLDSYRSGAFFESSRGRRKNMRVRQMIADMMFASGSLHLLNSHIRRLQRDTLAPVRIKSENLIDSIRLDFQEIQQQIQNGEIITAENQLQSLQNRTVQQLDELRISLLDDLNADQRLALDSLILLLIRFLAELRRYMVSYGQLLCPEAIKAAPPLPLAIARVQEKHWHASFDRPPTEIAQPLSAALRSMVVVAVVSLFWLNTAWPSGPEAVIIAVVLSALFSTFPNPLASVRQMGFGVLTAFLAALLFSLEFLPRISGFPMLALALLPFLLISPWLLTRTRWSGTAAGFGIFFPLFAIPGEGQEISYSALLNNGTAQLLAVLLVGIAFYLIFPVGNNWERRRLLQRFRELVRVAAQAPLPNLRNQFEAESREYLRLLAADLSPQQASDLKILREVMRLNELAEGILQLRILLHAQAEMAGEQPLSRYEAQYVTPLLEAFPKKYEVPMSANYENRLCAVMDAAANLPVETVDTALHPILPPDALFRVYVHVIASVSRRFSVASEAEHAR